MIPALRAETRRLLSRRLTLVALLALLGLIALFQLQVNAQVTPPSASEVAQAQQDYDRYVPRLGGQPRGVGGRLRDLRRHAAGVRGAAPGAVRLGPRSGIVP